ncbi:MAG: hypothetical protein MJA31_14725 [Clostridia bacterium]|nr:hypothetical protein [Clostridia bacterium]
MNINIRNEQSKDYRRVEKVARDAFWNLYFVFSPKEKKFQESQVEYETASSLLDE